MQALRRTSCILFISWDHNAVDDEAVRMKVESLPRILYIVPDHMVWRLRIGTKSVWAQVEVTDRDDRNEDSRYSSRHID